MKSSGINSPLKVNHRFGGTCRLHHQHWRASQIAVGLMFDFLFNSLRCRWHVPPKLRLNFVVTNRRYTPVDTTFHGNEISSSIKGVMFLDLVVQGLWQSRLVRGDGLDLYSGGLRYESQPRQTILKLSEISVPTSNGRDSTFTTAFSKILFNLIFNNHLTIGAIWRWQDNINVEENIQWRRQMKGNLKGLRLTVGCWDFGLCTRFYLRFSTEIRRQ
jgi:hypothetical protein